MTRIANSRIRPIRVKDDGRKWFVLFVADMPVAEWDDYADPADTPDDPDDWRDEADEE